MCKTLTMALYVFFHIILITILWISDSATQFYRWGNRVSEAWKKLSKVTYVIKGGFKFQTQTCIVSKSMFILWLVVIILQLRWESYNLTWIVSFIVFHQLVCTHSQTFNQRPIFACYWGWYKRQCSLFSNFFCKSWNLV